MSGSVRPSIEEVEFGALLVDAAILAKDDPAFQMDLERFVFPDGRTRLAFTAMVALARRRPVPWTTEELLREFRRRIRERYVRRGG